MQKPIFCYVTDRSSLTSVGADEMLLGCVARAARAGVDWIQLREKHLEGGALFELTRQVMRASAAIRVLVNDRLDVAWTAGAAGVHLGESSLPVDGVIRWRTSAADRADFLVGASCHSLEDAARNTRAGADYIFFGPVFATPSKAAFGSPQGIERLRQVCRAVSIPVLAIGGITEENAAACLEAGASGIAAIRMFQEEANLPGALSRIRNGG